jgi:hypothetical protein
MDVRQIVQLVHIFIFGPLLVFIGLGGYIPQIAVAALGVFITAYHAYKAVNTQRWVNIFHALVVGPLLLIEGLSAAPRYVRESILMLGFAAIGYHGYYYLTS